LNTSTKLPGEEKRGGSLDTFNAELDGSVVHSPGIDWGRKLEVLHQKGKYVVVRRKGHMTWGGNYSPRNYAETLYMLLRLDPQHVTAKESLNGKAYDKTVAAVLRSCEPGKDWRTAVTMLKTQCDAEGALRKTKTKETT